MSELINPVITYRKDYKAPEFSVTSVHLDIDIISPEEVIVTNHMHLERLPNTSQPLLLDGECLELLEIQCDGKKLSQEQYQCNAESLTFNNTPNTPFELIIKTRCNPQANTLLSGLYYADGLFCTQCESSGFRRITYYFDRPDVLSKFSVDIKADRTKYPVLLSNGNCIAQKENSATWEDPFKKPAYLFALVVGDLVSVEDYFVTCSGRVVTLKIYVNRGNEDKCAHAMESLKNSMRWDEQAYGREYDLDIYMIVAVRSFNMGAMENKGLNVFNAKYVLARPETASDMDFIGIERVIGHEYFHNWTGNRVTCQDWFQLSLKEGLTVFRDQEFTLFQQKSDVTRIQDVKTLRSSQFSEDASPMAHPVRPESYIEINNFYTATVYNKGAEVIRMQKTLLGEAGFRRGMDLYFERHDGQAVTIDDFVASMSDANGRDMSQFKRWYSQSGTPEVHVQTVYDKATQKYTVTLSQTCPATPGQPTKDPFHIPVKFALWNTEGQKITTPESVLELTDATQSFSWENISSAPIISLFRDFSAPVKWHIEYTQAELVTLIQAEDNDFARFEALQRLNYKILASHLSNQEKVLPLSSEVIEVYRALLTHPKLDALFKGEILMFPTFMECAQTLLGHPLSFIDVDALENIRHEFQVQIGASLHKEFLEYYTALEAKATNAMTAEAFAARRLKATCLHYLVISKHKNAEHLALQQLKSAQTMTDEVSAFSSLMLASTSSREEAIHYFYTKWQDNDLVLDKWFAAQAQIPEQGTLARVQTLLNHPKFDKNNPNKIKALLGAYWNNNPQNFHAKDGSSYRAFVPLILAFDKINSFVSAGLARSLMNWKQFDSTRQALMKMCLSEILQAHNTEPLSKDLFEIVSKSLH